MGDGFLLLRGRNPDLCSRGSALVDRHEHSNYAVNEPGVETQDGKQRITQTSAFKIEREVRKER